MHSCTSLNTLCQVVKTSSLAGIQLVVIPYRQLMVFVVTYEKSQLCTPSWVYGVCVLHSLSSTPAGETCPLLEVAPFVSTSWISKQNCHNIILKRKQGNYLMQIHLTSRNIFRTENRTISRNKQTEAYWPVEHVQSLELSDVNIKNSRSN